MIWWCPNLRPGFNAISTLKISHPTTSFLRRSLAIHCSTDYRQTRGKQAGLRNRGSTGARCPPPTFLKTRKCALLLHYIYSSDLVKWYYFKNTTSFYDMMPLHYNLWIIFCSQLLLRQMIKNKNIIIHFLSYLRRRPAVLAMGGGSKNKKCRCSLSWQVPFLGVTPPPPLSRASAACGRKEALLLTLG